MSAHKSARCRKLLALLSEYLDGRLSRPACQEIESHMGHCAPCRALLRNLEQMVAACRALRAEKPSPRRAAQARAAAAAKLCRR